MPGSGISWSSPATFAIYVEHGAADVGLVGKDILAESNADVYELLDTGMGRCRMCVAGPKTFVDDESRALRVATKFENIARAHYEGTGREIDIIKLNGSIELAPILGLSDVIVDIVETGTTLAGERPDGAGGVHAHLGTTDCQQGKLQIQAERHQPLCRMP